ncbi:MAG: glycosyltransferase family 4 protein [Calditrichota bacterium]
MKILLTAYVRFRNALAWNTFELARTFHSAGHDVFLCCQRESPLAKWSGDAGLPFNADLNLNSASPGEIINGLWTMRQIIRKFKPDIINPHCPPGHTFLALARRFERYRTPLIRTIADPRPPKNNPLNRWLNRRLTDGLIVTTRSSLERYEAVIGANHPPARIILPGFRSDEFIQTVENRNYRQTLRLNDDVLLAGIIARMSPEKGQEVLLKALSLLNAEDRNRLFVALAGEDSRERGRSDLEAIAQRYHVADRVAFLGELDDVRPLMSELDLGIITSTRSEAICRVALEYMSFGIPVISSDVNILPEVVHHGQNGWVFPNHNAVALAECLHDAIASTEERRRRGETGAVMIKSVYDYRREAKDYSDFFSQHLSATESQQP